MIPLEEAVHFDVITSSSTGAAVDADSTPTFSVYEEATDTAIIGPENFTKRTSLTGNYRGTFIVAGSDGFEVGKWYSVIASATVGGVAGKAVVKNFRVGPAENVEGVPTVDVSHAAGTAWNSGAIGANTLASDTITAAKIAADAITDAKVASDVTIASVTGSVGSVTGAVGSVTGNVGGNVTGSIGSLATQAKADVNAEVDAAISDAALATAANLATATGYIDTEVAAIKAVTDKLDNTLTLTSDGYVFNGNALQAVWDEPIAGHLVTGTAGWMLNEIQGVVDGILVYTAEIGAAGAGLTAIPWNPAWDAEVQSECEDALAAYDPPTNAEMVARTLAAADYATAAALATVDTVVDAIKVTTDKLDNTLTLTSDGYVFNSVALQQVWDEPIAGHLVSGSTGAALNAAGAAGDPWSTPLPGAYGAGTAGYIVDAINDVATALFTTLQATSDGYAFTANSLEFVPAPSASAIADEVQTRTIAAVTVVNSLANNSVTAAALAADAGTEIGTAVWASATRTLTALDEDSTTIDIDTTLRSAVGLASANLDTQLGAIETDTQDIQSRIPAALVNGQMDSTNSDTVVRGTAAGSSTTTSILTSAFSPSGAAADQFKGRIVVFDNDTATAALRGQATDITASTNSATPTLTVTALTTAPASGDTFSVL